MAFDPKVAPATRLAAMTKLLNTIGVLSPNQTAKPEDDEAEDFGKWTEEELEEFMKGDTNGNDE